MQHMKTITSLLTVTLLCGVSHAEWITIDGIIPELSQTERISTPISNPSTLTGKDKWQVYYQNTEWYDESIHPAGSNSLLIGGSNADNERNNQIATNFQLTDSQISDAEKVRVSFDMNYFGSNSVHVTIVPPAWEIIEITPGFRSITPFNSSTQTYANFSLGLMSLQTGRYIPATITDTMTNTVVNNPADYDAVWRVVTTGDDHKFNVSFELSGEDLLAGEYSLVLTTNMNVYWLNMGSVYDYYYVDNVKVEKQLITAPIPESSSALLGVFGLSFLAARRKRGSR